MEEIDLRNIWINHSSNIEANLEMNFTSLKNTNLKSTRLRLNMLVSRRIAESLVFLVITIFLIAFIVGNSPIPQYLISALVLCSFSIIGAIGSICQIVQIIRLDYSKPVTGFLIQLEKLKMYSLQTLRLVILSIPFYFAYIIIGFKVLFNYDIYTSANSKWILWNLILSIVFVPFVLYLFKQLNINAKRNWVKKLIADNGGKQIDSSIQFINEIVEYKTKESANDITL